MLINAVGAVSPILTASAPCLPQNDSKGEHVSCRSMRLALHDFRGQPPLQAGQGEAIGVSNPPGRATSAPSGDAWQPRSLSYAAPLLRQAHFYPPALPAGSANRKGVVAAVPGSAGLGPAPPTCKQLPVCCAAHEPPSTHWVHGPTAGIGVIAARQHTCHQEVRIWIRHRQATRVGDGVGREPHEGRGCGTDNRALRARCSRQRRAGEQRRLAARGRTLTHQLSSTSRLRDCGKTKGAARLPWGESKAGRAQGCH